MPVSSRKLAAILAAGVVDCFRTTTADRMSLVLVCVGVLPSQKDPGRRIVYAKGREPPQCFSHQSATISY